MDNEPSYGKKLISEMIHIKKQPYGLNKQSDTDLLSDTYLSIIELLLPNLFSFFPSLLFVTSGNTHERRVTLDPRSVIILAFFLSQNKIFWQKMFCMYVCV